MSNKVKHYKEVFYFKYCGKCRHGKSLIDEYPCYDCMNNDVNSTGIPVYFEDANSRHKPTKIISVTVTDSDVEKLNVFMNRYNISRAEVVRRAIREMWKKEYIKK